MTDDVSASQQVAWLLEAKVKSGQREALEGLLREAIEATSEDPNALNYEFFMDGDELHVFEKYTDSAATLAHLGWFGENIAERFLDMVDLSRFTVYGSPSDDVRGVLDQMGATYLEAFGGFAR